MCVQAFVHLVLSSFSVFSVVPPFAAITHSPLTSALTTSPDNQLPYSFQGGPH